MPSPPTARHYDAIVIGSGATGGVAAMQFCRAGLRTLVLEAGPALKGGHAFGSDASNLTRQLYEHFIRRRQKVQELHPAYWRVNPALFVDDARNPYAAPPDKPYRWIRGRQVGGRSHTWGGVTLRLSDYEFKAASRDGIGDDWPISHADLDPHYAMLETFFGTHGNRDGLPQLPDGNFCDPSPMSPGEQAFKFAVEARFRDRRVIISRGIKAAHAPERHEQFSRLSSPRTTLAAAQATGNLELRSNAVVRRIVLDPASGKARGVEFIDCRTRSTQTALGGVVFLCASTIESLRILMNSGGDRHPGGLGARAGLLGKCLMDHVGGMIYFGLPEVRADDGEHYELLGSDSILIPRYQNLGDARAPHHRGYGFWGGIQRLSFPPMLRKWTGGAIGFLCAMGEALPHADNQMRLDDSITDAWGLPAPFISCSWTANDIAVAKAARAAAEEMITAAGGVVLPLSEIVRTPLLGHFMAQMQREWVVTTPGLFVHEVGGARMGRDPSISVVNPFCQVWEAENVFVTDGACWVSSGWQNPTLTEMAITARACARAVAEFDRLVV